MTAGPDCHVILPAPYDRAEWLKRRRDGVGGSDAAPVLGLSPYKSAYEVWLDKVGELPEGDDEPGPDSPMYWGTALEDDIADAFELTTGLTARAAPGLCASNDRPWQFANPDRLVYDGRELVGILECKATSQHFGADWDGDELPVPALLQTQHYLCVTGLPRAWVAGLIGGRRFVCKELAPDPELHKLLIEREAMFWQAVQSGQPPEPDGSKGAGAAVRARWPEATDDDGLVLSPDEYRVVREIERLDARIKTWSQEREALAQLIQDKLGVHAAGYYDDEPVVRWTNVSSQRIDQKALRADHPEIADKYTKTSTYRRFTVTKGAAHGDQ